MASRDITPISFKTVPGRNRTQKWSKAPTQTYDGDDWGGYDPYDDSEYSEPPPPMPTSQLPRDLYNGSPQLARASSFDRGDESRQFSAGQPSHFAGKDVNRQPSSATPQQHATPKDLSSSGSRPRDPEQVPPPLTANSPRASAEQFPPRRSSRSSGTPSLPATTFSPPTRETSPAVDKPLPFIRPADIYKRHAEELRRQSEDGIRPSLDSLSREKSPPPLDSVAENRESRMYETEEQPSPERLRVRDTSPTLPLVTRFSGFGTDFLTGSLGAGIGGHALNDGSSSSNTQAIADRVTSAPVVRADEPSSLQHTPTSAERDSAPAGLGNTDNADLQHRPSKGFRSAVDTAFDRNDDEISRDNSASSQQGSGEISPIMSRVPSGATATLERKRMEEQMPSIAETTPAGSRPASDSRGRVVSGDFEPGYRRSMDPPSTGSSPARTPALDNTANRRLSTPLSAVPMDAESADVLDQGAEMPSVTLEPTENSKPLAIKTRGRSGTDYSMRESDIANEINASSPDTGGFSPALLAAQKNDQALFLETHSDLKAPPSPMSPGGRSPGGKSQDGSRAGSPSKGRVREIADKFSGLDDAAGSRRNSAISVGSSKSSWSNFGEPRQGLSRPDTNRSLLGNEVERPGVQREESFVPDVPGGWISSAPTPEPGTGREPQYPQATPRAQRNASDEDIDLTPTTKKHQLRGSGSHQDSPTTLEQVKNAGAQLGASLLSATGMGHQTRDFASSESAAPREETPEPRMIRGDQPMQPPMYRHDTENSEAPTSIASSMPPTPISKETPAGETLSSDYFKAVAPLRVKSREATPPGSREGGLRPQVTSAYPSEMGPGDMESDRLRKEIVRSLDPIPHDEAIEDTQRTQDALDAPTNERRVEQGLPTLPAAETSRQPGLLQTRFSWEAPSAPELVHSPEIKPEMPYERGTSKTLHVMNVGNETPDTPTVINPTQQESEDGMRDESYLSPITEADGSMPPASPRRSLQDVPPSPMSTHDRSHINDDAHDGSGRISSDARQSSDARHSSDARNASLDAPASPSPISHKTAPPPVRTSAQQPHKPIPPFRSILALKTSEDRIASYNETRTTFAEMNTGLSDWLRAMSAQHSDITAAPLGPPPALGVNTGAGSTSSLPSGFLKGHKNSPSLAKFTRNFSGSGTGLDSGGPGSSSAGPVGGQRNVSSSSGAPAQDGDSSRPAIDTEELKLKGKAFMQKTGVLGGKAQAGAKGLFAKGRSRFGGGGGGEKVPKSSSASSPSSSAKFLRRLSSQPQVQTSPSATHPPTIPAAAAPATGSTATLPTKVTTSNPSALPAPRAVASAAPIVSSAAVVKVGDLPLTTSTSVAVGGGDVVDVPRVSDTATLRDAVSLTEGNDGVEDERAFEGFDGEFAMEDENVQEGGVLNVDAVDEGEGAPSIAQPAQPARKDGGDVDADKRVARGDKHGAETIPAYVVRDSTIASAADPLVQGTTSAPLPAKKDAETAAEPPFATNSVEELFTTSIPASLADSATITTPASNTTPTTQAPIHANRPRLFARHSSSRSISSLPGKTAKESSSSRPLSMLFGDWMREKSRSRSRSRSSKSATGSQGVETPASQPRSSLAVPKSSTSRPSSLVLHESAAEDGPMAEHGNAEPPFVLSDFSDVAVRPTAPTDDAGPMSPMSQNGEEAWNSPDATLPLASPAAEGKAVGRLGVLPSPAPTAAAFESGRRASMEPSRRRSSAAPLKFLDEDGKPAVVLEPVPSEDSVLQEDNGGAERDLSSPPAVVGTVEPARSTLRKVSEGTGVHDDEHDDEKKEEDVVMKARPQHQRKVSDRERLPSQLAKRLSEGRPRPDSMVLAHLNFGSEESWGGLKSPGGGKKEEMTAEPDTIVSSMGEGDVGAGPSTTEKRASKLMVEPEARDDDRSEVSAEHPQEEEGPQPSTRLSTSRRSSVSSLGVVAGSQIDQPFGMSLTGAQVADVEPSATSPNGTVQSPASIEQPAVASKPAFESSESMLSPQRPMMDDRGMSYTTLPRDASGLPVPETITTTAQSGSLQQTASAGPQASSVPVDLSVMGGPPAGTPPFQQHPLFRSAEQERDGAQETVIKESGIIQRSVSQQAQRDNGFGGAPPPNQITDDHGLDDIYAFNQLTSDVQPKEEADAPPGEKQGKRRSMIWDTLKHRRQASFRKGEDGSRHNSMAAPQPEASQDSTAAVNAPAAEETKSETPRRATLQQPLRTQVTMAEKAPKKKRFSALGSIFGRSGTPAPGSPKAMADNSPSKPKKLTKAAPSEREAMAQSPVMNKRAADSSTVSGNINAYDQYEAARKRDMPAYQDTAINAQRQAPQPRLPNLQPDATAGFVQPPPEGWYGSPSEDETSQRTIPPPQAGQPMPVHRRMHSEGGERYRSTNPVSESFRPVEASYDAPVDSIGPPSSQDIPYHPAESGYGQRRSQDHGRFYPYGAPVSGPPPNAPRQLPWSDSMDIPAYDQRQSGGQPQHYPPYQRGPYGPPDDYGRRPSRELARSPAHEYAEQQPPWALAIPSIEQASHDPRSPQWTTSPDGQYPPPDAAYYQQQQYPQQRRNPPSRPSSTRPYPPVIQHNPGRTPMYDNPPPRSQTAGPEPQSEPRRFSFDSVGPHRPQNPPRQSHDYERPRQRPASTQYPPQNHYSRAQPPPPRAAQPRYYAQQQSPQNYAPHASFGAFTHQPPRGGGGGPYPPYSRRPSSGYSGRRDDPTVGEEEVIMRGASYPGQEWTPMGMGKWD